MSKFRGITFARIFVVNPLLVKQKLEASIYKVGLDPTERTNIYPLHCSSVKIIYFVNENVIEESFDRQHNIYRYFRPKIEVPN